MLLLVSRSGLRIVVLSGLRVVLLFVVGTGFSENFLFAAVVGNGRGEALQLPGEVPHQFGTGFLVDARGVPDGGETAFVSVPGETLELSGALRGDGDGPGVQVRH